MLTTEARGFAEATKIIRQAADTQRAAKQQLESALSDPEHDGFRRGWIRACEGFIKENKENA